MNIPELPNGDKFSAGPACIPGGPVVDSALGMNGYMVCSGCRGIIALGIKLVEPGMEWIHLP